MAEEEAKRLKAEKAAEIRARLEEKKAKSRRQKEAKEEKEELAEDKLRSGTLSDTAERLKARLDARQSRSESGKVSPRAETLQRGSRAELLNRTSKAESAGDVNAKERIKARLEARRKEKEASLSQIEDDILDRDDDDEDMQDLLKE